MLCALYCALALLHRFNANGGLTYKPDTVFLGANLEPLAIAGQRRQAAAMRQFRPYCAGVGSRYHQNTVLRCDRQLRKWVIGADKQKLTG